MVIIVGVTAVAGFSLYLRRRAKSLKSENQKQFAAAPPYRSLFEPNEEEVRVFERKEKAKIEADRLAAESQVLFEKSKQISEFEQIWRAAPNTSNTVELLRLAAASENAKVFSQTAENVLQIWRENKIENLTSTDLADLLDSHLRILPQQERFSGAAFWIRQEINCLRGKSE